MHSEVEAAIQWRDGFEFHYLNGVYLPKELWQKIVSKTIPAQEAIKLENQEHRTLALQYIGGEKLMTDLGGKIIGKDQYGEIIELNLKDTQGKKFRYYVAVDPSKNEKIYLRTWPDVESPKDAMTRAYRLGRLELTYEPESRT